LKVGLMLPFSGTFAGLGENIAAAFELYITEQGGKLGGRPVTLVRLDDESDPAKAPANVNRLLERDSVDALVGTVLTAATLASLAFILYVILKVCQTRAQRERMMLAVVLIFGSVVFFTLFEQAGTSLNLFADRNVDLSLTPTAFQLFGVTVGTPAQLAAARIIHQRVHGVQFVLALAPTVDREEVIAHVEKARRTEAPNPALRCHEDEGTNRPGAVPIPVGGNGVPKTDDFGRRQADWLRRAAELPPPSGDFPLAILEEATYDLMALSDVLICASGTATLEAAILGRPMVIMYRLAQSNWLEYQFVKKKLPRFIGMPNILAEREICPELIQEKATPENIADAIVGLLLEPDTLQRMRVDLRATVKLLGEPGGATRTAQMAIELAQSRRDGTSFSKTG
jgi:hypothetical protein